MNNKGASQTAWVCRLACAFVIRKPPKSGFFESWPNYVSIPTKYFFFKKYLMRIILATMPETLNLFIYLFILFIYTIFQDGCTLAKLASLPSDPL